MNFKSIWIVALSVILATPVMALGEDESSSAAAPAEYEKGVKAVKVNDFVVALPLFKIVVEKDPTNANAWNYLGYSYRKLKQFDEALVAYKEALAIKPDHRGANEYIGELYLETGQLAKAKERLKVLDSACLFGCEEYDELKAAIAAYETKS
jgi:Flp pilus assembly protein TadD